MKLKFLQIESCCFYMSLRSGSKLFGFLSLTGSLLLLLFGCFDLIFSSAIDHDIEPQEHLLVGLDLTVQIVQVSCSMLLLLGVYQGKSTLIPFWLVTTPVVASLETSLLPSISWRFIRAEPYNVDWIICTTITLFDDVYGWLVVYSYYCTMLPPENVTV